MDRRWLAVLLVIAWKKRHTALQLAACTPFLFIMRMRTQLAVMAGVKFHLCHILLNKKGPPNKVWEVVKGSLQAE